MVLEIEKRRYFFKTKEIWFADRPHDVMGVDMVIFQGCKTKVNASGFHRKESATFVIDLTQNLDAIWNNISSGNGRKAIRRAQRAGVKIKMNQRHEEFFRLYKSVREEKELSGLMRLEDIQKYGTLFVAEYEGTVISGHAYLEDQNNIRSWVAGSARFEGDKEHATLVANAGKLIVWEAIQYAKEKGIREFDFGGYRTGAMEDKVLDAPNWFKQSFGGKVDITYIYKKDYSKSYIFLRDLYAQLSRLLVQMRRKFHL